TLQTIEHCEAIHEGHLQIEQDQIGAVREPQRFDAIRHMLDFVTQFPQPVAQDAADARIVVGDDDATHAAPTMGAVGSVGVNRLPRAGSDSTAMSPPCSRAMFRAIASPSPLPVVPSADLPR